MTTREVELKCSDWQADAWESDVPVLAAVTPRGDGKTHFGSRFATLRGITYPESLVLVTGNGYPQCRDLLIPSLEEAADEFGVSFSLNKQDSVVTLGVTRSTKATVLVRSTESDKMVDRLRGLEFGTWWQDEGRDARAYVFQVVMSLLRCRRVPVPLARLTTTPGGLNWLYDTFVVAPPTPRRQLLHVTARSNLELIPGYDDALREDMDPDLARQELEAAFINLGAGNVYRAFDPRVHVRSLRWQDDRPITLGVDYGAVCYATVNQMVSGIFLTHDEFKTPDVYKLAVDVDAEYPHGEIDLYDDTAMGGARTATGRTWRAMLIEAFHCLGRVVNVRTKLHSNPPVTDRTNAVNAAMMNARREIRYYVDPRCKEVIRDYQSVAWKADGSGIDKSNLSLTHYSDSVGYPVHKIMRPQAFRSEPGYGTSRPGLHSLGRARR